MTSSLKNRLKKLEQKNNVDFDFDISRPLTEWSTPELIAYRKNQDPEYEPPDLSGLNIDELRNMRDKHQCTQH